MADESAHVLALAVSAERLPSAHGPVNPICMLFRADPFALIGHTEWHTAARTSARILLTAASARRAA